MKALEIALAAAIALASSGISLAASNDAAMQDCFSKHGQLMAKPAVKNARDCCHTHGYLMQGQR